MKRDTVQTQCDRLSKTKNVIVVGERHVSIIQDDSYDTKRREAI